MRTVAQASLYKACYVGTHELLSTCTWPGDVIVLFGLMIIAACSFARHHTEAPKISAKVQIRAASHKLPKVMAAAVFVGFLLIVLADCQLCSWWEALRCAPRNATITYFSVCCKLQSILNVADSRRHDVAARLWQLHGKLTKISGVSTIHWR